jgi:hypothetical protein
MVSRRLPTAMAWVRDQVTSCGIAGGQRSAETGVLRLRLFPLSIIHSTVCSIIIIIYYLILEQWANKWPQ